MSAVNPIVVERRYKTSREPDAPTITKHLYWCPGCDALHGIAVRPSKQRNGASWEFSGTLECPTYSPSQLTTWEQGPERTKFVCHTFIRNGQIEFLNDCTHEFRGKMVPLPPLPDWVLREDD
jgi:hypothetical protein